MISSSVQSFDEDELSNELEQLILTPTISGSAVSECNYDINNALQIYILFEFFLNNHIHVHDLNHTKLLYTLLLIFNNFLLLLIFD